MRSFSTLALILPAVLAAPLKSTTHHQHSPSCVIAGVSYPDPHHTLVLLGRRELRPPTGLSERAFTDFLIFCHESGGRSSSSPLVVRQQGSSYLSNALGNPAGSDSMFDTTTPGGAPRPPASGDQRDQSASSSAASSSSTTPATATSPTPSPSETSGSAAEPTSTSTGTPAGNETPEAPANSVGSPSSGNTAATTVPADNDASHDTDVSEAPLAQSDSSAFDTFPTTTPQGAAASFDSPFMDSNVSNSFTDVSGSNSDVLDGLDGAPVDNGGEPFVMDAQGGI
ncbi:hypothetical protein BD769DRAFT_1776632 [Suillus cothurnatus]|nr:hypothetical protein BD769DRAFT_1776632 [Suillus cothurnatus]